MIERKWPLFGYAPGGYMCNCLRCGDQFTGDKRAWHCLPCAEQLDGDAKARGAAYWADLAALEDQP